MSAELKNCLTCVHGLGRMHWYDLQDNMSFRCENRSALRALPACVRVRILWVEKDGDLFFVKSQDHDGLDSVISHCPAHQTVTPHE